MVRINFLHVNQNLSILQCVWNRQQVNMFVFQIKLLKHLLVKLCDITKYFKLLLCNLCRLSTVKLSCSSRSNFSVVWLHYVIINGKYQHIRGLKYTADFIIQKKNGVYFRLDNNLQTFVKCFHFFSFLKICNI